MLETIYLKLPFTFASMLFRSQITSYTSGYVCISQSGMFQGYPSCKPLSRMNVISTIMNEQVEFNFGSRGYFSSTTTQITLAYVHRFQKASWAPPSVFLSFIVALDKMHVYGVNIVTHRNERWGAWSILISKGMLKYTLTTQATK